jgi:hypothetical protein
MTVRNIAKIVGRIAAAVLIIAIFVYAYFLNTYIYFPRSPSPEAGRTVPFEVKGIIVYITQQQSDQLHWLLWATISSGVIFLLAVLILGREAFKRRS